MNSARAHASAEPFFLAHGGGERFCLFHPASTGQPVRGGIVLVPPFAEEMNKSRRMAALQARTLAASGYAVLQLDLFGCGDSSGELGEASWQHWRDDVAAAVAWLGQKIDAPVSLCGLRLGALLALDCAQAQPGAFEKIILCQPVLQGATYLTQFLRMQLAGAMFSAADMAQDRASSAALRATLAAGTSIEIGGYDISPRLAEALDALDAAKLVLRDCPVHWIDIMIDASRPLPPARQRVAAAWLQQGVSLQQHQISGPAFWATQEISECPALLPLLTSIFAAEPA